MTTTTLTEPGVASAGPRSRIRMGGLVVFAALAVVVVLGAAQTEHRWAPSATPVTAPTALPADLDTAVDSVRHRSRATAEQQFPVVAANGGFLILWSDARRGQFDVYGARVARNGTVTDPDGFLVGGAVSDPAVTRGPGSKWTLTYGRAGDISLATVAPK
jgi:hypothetical protein